MGLQNTVSIQMLNILCLCPSYAVVVVFHLRVYKIDQCLSREARTTDRIHCLTSKYFIPVPLGSDFVTWVRVWQRTSFKHPTALWFDVRHLVKHASQLQPRLLCLP